MVSDTWENFQDLNPDPIDVMIGEKSFKYVTDSTVYTYVHPNTEKWVTLLDNSETFCRLKRKHPLDLTN